MSEPITYRLATEADTELLIHYRILLLDTVTTTNHSKEESEQVKRDLALYFPKAIANGSYISWFAYCGNDIASIAGMVIYERPCSYNCPTGRVGYILNMYTVPEHRGKGLCKTLLDKLVQTAKEHNISVLSLHASPDGEPVYRKYGFEEPFSPVLEMHLSG